MLIVADTNIHYVCPFRWWFGTMEFDFMGLMAAVISFVDSNYPVIIITKNINDCQHRTSLYIVVIIRVEKRAVILLQIQSWSMFEHCNGSLHSLLCISLQCTLCKRSQPEDCSIPVQGWALTHSPSGVFVLFWYVCFQFVLLSISLFIVYYFVCIPLFLFVYLDLIVMNAVIPRLFNPLRRGHSFIVIPLYFSLSVFCAHLCQGYVVICSLFEYILQWTFM